MRMIAGFLIALCSLSLASCGASAGGGIANIPPPIVIADKTKLDEQVLLATTLAYTAATKAATLAIRSHVVTDRDRIRRIGVINDAAFIALQDLRRAYAIGNADSYRTASERAQELLKRLLTSF